MSIETTSTENNMITIVINKLQSAYHDLQKNNERMAKIETRLMGDYPQTASDEGEKDCNGDISQLTIMADYIIETIEKQNHYIDEFDKL